MNRILYILLFVAIVVTGCRGNKPQETFYAGGPVKGLKRVEAPFVTLDFVDGVRVDYDDLVEEIKYLQLGNEKGLIGQILRILYHKNRYYVYDDAQDMVFIFDGTTGECIRKINSKGRGPKEYLGIGNIDINKEADELIIVDRMQKQALFYDLDGNYKYNRTVPIQTGTMFWMRDTTFVYNALAHQNTGADELEEYGLMFAAGDSVIGKGFPYLPSQIGARADFESLKRGYDDVLYYMPLCSDSIYRINPDMTYSLAAHAKLRNSLWERLNGSEKFAFVIGYEEKGDRIYSRFHDGREFIMGYAHLTPRRNKKADVYVYDKAKQVTYIMDIKQYDNISRLDRFWGYDPVGVSDDYFIFMAGVDAFEDAEIKKKVKNGTMEVTDPALKKIIDNIGYNDNPVIILTKFKSL